MKKSIIISIDLFLEVWVNKYTPSLRSKTPFGKASYKLSIPKPDPLHFDNKKILGETMISRPWEINVKPESSWTYRLNTSKSVANRSCSVQRVIIIYYE